MLGPSAYGGGLWLAALSAAAAMAAELGEADAEHGYRAAWERGRTAHERLWNGRCFDYDGGGGASSDSIMADQLCGQWYADACGLPAYVSPERVATALSTIYRANVLGFADGAMGAVNGVRRDGRVDDSAEQSSEVWSGVTYALAAFMFGRGFEAEAWATARGAVRVTYERGYWFRTPEAWDAAGNFRAALYMRPLAIWAIEEARERARRGAATRP
jgi:non-lysosomal glucosylceramidase